MAKGEGVVPYLKRLTQIRDKLGAVGSKTVDEELVRIALNGFSKPWDTFVKGVVTREKLPNLVQIMGCLSAGGDPHGSRIGLIQQCPTDCG